MRCQRKGDSTLREHRRGSGNRRNRRRAGGSRWRDTCLSCPRGAPYPRSRVPPGIFIIFFPYPTHTGAKESMSEMNGPCTRVTAHRVNVRKIPQIGAEG